MSTECDCGLCGPKIEALLEATAASKARVGLETHWAEPDTWIAEHVSVSHTTVSNLRREISNNLKFQNGNKSLAPEKPRRGPKRGPRQEPKVLFYRDGEKITLSKKVVDESERLRMLVIACSQTKIDYDGPVDEELLWAVGAARDHWSALVSRLEAKYHDQEENRPSSQTPA